jgi:hypothetical protein
VTPENTSTQKGDDPEPYLLRSPGHPIPYLDYHAQHYWGGGAGTISIGAIGKEAVIAIGGTLARPSTSTHPYSPSNSHSPPPSFCCNKCKQHRHMHQPPYPCILQRYFSLPTTASAFIILHSSTYDIVPPRSDRLYKKYLCTTISNPSTIS